MTVGDVSFQEDYRYLVHKVGSIYKAKSGVTSLTEFENPLFSSLMQSCITNVGSSGQKIKIAAYGSGATGYIVDAPITANGSQAYLNIEGENQYTSNLIPAGDFPAFEFTDLAYMDIQKVGFYNNDASRGDFTPFIKLINHCVVGTINRCSFYQPQAKGVGVGGFIDETTANHDYLGTESYFTNNFFRSLNCPWYWDSSNSTFAGPWFNGLVFYGNNYSGTRYVEKTNLKTGSTYAGNFRELEMYQSSPNAIGGFDWDDAGSHTNNYHKNVFLWDLNYAGNFYAKLSPRDYLSVEGGSPTINSFFIGSGIGNGAYVERRGSASYREGIAQFSADGKTTDFTVTHNMQTTPTGVNIMPMSKDAAGPRFIFTKGNPTFVVRYLSPPPPATPVGNMNVEFSWECKA